MTETYFIKPGYIHKTAAPTVTAEGEQYWTADRLSSSKYYQYHVYTYARDLIKKFGLKSCVDVGCGSGYKLTHVIAPTGAEVLGIDQPYIINRAQKIYPDGKWQIADFENPLNTTDKKFDMILSVDVIEHLLNPDELLSYLKQFAHKDSYILISTPERDVVHGVANMQARNTEHIREWNSGEFRAYLNSRGLEVEEIKLLPGMKFHISKLYYSYLRNNWWKQNYNMLAVCRIR